MSVHSILESTSFSTLEKVDAHAVHALFNENYLKGEAFSLDHQELFRQRESLAVSLTIYSRKLKELDPVIFDYLSVEQRARLEEELLFAFYIFSAQYQLDEAEHRRQNHAERSEQLMRSAELLERLQSIRLGSSREMSLSPEDQLAREVARSEKHAKYLGLTIVGPYIAEKMVELSSAKTAVIVDWMTAVNGRRLYWVWGGGLLSSVISLLPDDFANKPQTAQVAACPSPVTGYMSWILYYARFGIQLSLLIKHTYPGWWMSDKEKQISMGERLLVQWEQRKYALLNDSIWGIANMAGFFWLTGCGMAGYFGNLLTASLLFMDAYLASQKLDEEEERYALVNGRFERDKTQLKDRIMQTRDPAERQRLKEEYKAVLESQEFYNLEWTYKKKALRNDLLYAISLFAAFAIACCFFLTPALVPAATGLLWSAAGAALCFSLNALSAAVAGGFEIDKSEDAHQLSLRSAYKNYQLLLAQFEDCGDEEMKRQLHLGMMQVFAKTNHQRELITSQKRKLAHAIFVDLMIPSSLFCTFMFLPFNLGLAVFAGGLSLVVLTYCLLQAVEPKEVKVIKWNEDDYDSFVQKPVLESLKVNQYDLRFFSEKPEAYFDGPDIGFDL